MVGRDETPPAAGRPVTSHDVARLAAVSRATVSRSLANDPSVAVETRNRVLRAAADLGYQVNMLGRSMTRQKADLIGVVVRRLQDPFRIAQLEPLLRAIARAGYDAIVTQITNQEESDRAMRRFVQYRVSGVIVTSGSPPPAIAADCVRLEIPVVVTNQDSVLPHIDIVRSDNAAGARLAAQHLIESGRRRLAFLNVEGGTYSGRSRGEAFAEALTPEIRRRRVSFRLLSAATADYQGGYAAAAGLDPAEGCPDGVLAANDGLACGFIDGLRRETALRVPEEIAVIGFDDIAVADWRSYDLTTIRQDVDLLAETTMDCLRARIARYRTPRRVHVVPVTLVERGSAAPPAKTRASRPS